MLTYFVLDSVYSDRFKTWCGIKFSLGSLFLNSFLSILSLLHCYTFIPRLLGFFFIDLKSNIILVMLFLINTFTGSLVICFINLYCLCESIFVCRFHFLYVPLIFCSHFFCKDLISARLYFLYFVCILTSL